MATRESSLLLSSSSLDTAKIQCEAQSGGGNVLHIQWNYTNNALYPNVPFEPLQRCDLFEYLYPIDPPKELYDLEQHQDQYVSQITTTLENPEYLNFLLVNSEMYGISLLEGNISVNNAEKLMPVSLEFTTESRPELRPMLYVLKQPNLLAASAALITKTFLILVDVQIKQIKFTYSNSINEFMDNLDKAFNQIFNLETLRIILISFNTQLDYKVHLDNSVTDTFAQFVTNHKDGIRTVLESLSGTGTYAVRLTKIMTKIQKRFGLDIKTLLPFESQTKLNTVMNSSSDYLIHESFLSILKWFDTGLKDILSNNDTLAQMEYIKNLIKDCTSTFPEQTFNAFVEKFKRIQTHIPIVGNFTDNHRFEFDSQMKTILGRLNVLLDRARGLTAFESLSSAVSQIGKSVKLGVSNVLTSIIPIPKTRVDDQKTKCLRWRLLLFLASIVPDEDTRLKSATDAKANQQINFRGRTLYYLFSTQDQHTFADEVERLNIPNGERYVAFLKGIIDSNLNSEKKLYATDIEPLEFGV